MGFALEDERKVTRSSDTAARLSVSVSVWQMIHVSACITQETPEESTRNDSAEKTKFKFSTQMKPKETVAFSCH